MNINGQLIVIGMGSNVDIPLLGQLSSNVLRWTDYNNPSISLANDINNAIICRMYFVFVVDNIVEYFTIQHHQQQCHIRIHVDRISQ